MTASGLARGGGFRDSATTMRGLLLANLICGFHILPLMLKYIKHVQISPKISEGSVSIAPPPECLTMPTGPG